MAATLMITIGVSAALVQLAPAPLPACVSEDAAGPCWWDAPNRGNGLGESFIVIEDGNVIYLPESETNK
jgi:hypothetical protein